MAKKAKGAAKRDDVIDVEVVEDSAAVPQHARPLGIATVAKPCLIGALVLTAVGAVLPH
jgi:hypothetical protein